MLSLSITPSSITMYKRANTEGFEQKILNQKSKEQKKRKTQENLKLKRQTNELSASSRKRLKNKINWLVYLSEPRKETFGKNIKIKQFRVAFITLKLPSKQQHPHGVIVTKRLNNFLNLLRKNHGIKNYVWRAELQKNGNLHFHILIDQILHHQVIRAYWNSSVNLLGYVDNYHKKFSRLSLQEYLTLRNSQGSTNYNQIKKAYYKGKSTNWKSPNSTDVHSLRKVRNAAAYVSKYMSKPSEVDLGSDYNESLKLLTGRLWYCSQSLSKLTNINIELTQEWKSLFKKIKKTKKSLSFRGDYFYWIGFSIVDLPSAVSNLLHSIFWKFARSVNYPVPYTKFSV